MNLTRLGPPPPPLLHPMEQRDGERRRLKKESDRPEMAPLLSPPHEPDLVAADVSRRICLLSRQRISADSRRRLRFRGSTRESFRGNLSQLVLQLCRGRCPLVPRRSGRSVPLV